LIMSDISNRNSTRRNVIAPSTFFTYMALSFKS
jgi:hypothetical protein